jgi:secreted protein with Ig-like and vWFA domain
VREALAVLARQLQPADRVSVVAFARTARLWIDALPGNEMDELLRQVAGLVPQGGTNLEEALRLAYATAARHHQPGGVSRVVLLTDGAANLGDVEPESLRELVVAQRRQGIALDCFGVGWDGYQDELLETLSRNGDGRYGFLNTPEEAVTGFADQLAGALQVAASDVKIQIEFNPQRVRHHRLIGYAKHQLTREQFRDNTVDAAELGAAESGNALYVIETDPAGSGPLGVARVRYKLPATDLYEEVEWVLAYEGPGIALDRASPALRLAGSAAAFAEWLASNPYAAEVSPAALLELMRGIPEVYTLDPRPRQLEWMIRQAGSISGR